jgi:protein-S-isoprenylcysteine O-methyltransferase Ste14
MKSEIRQKIAKGAVRVGIFYIILAVVLLGLSGHWDWVMGWVFMGVLVANYIINLTIVDPELMAERSGVKEGAKKYDIALALIMSGLGTVVVILISALDKRFAWSPGVSVGVLIAGLALVVIGCIFVTWAMVSNKFFGPVVRIQTERGHSVASAGPYKFIRHPGYLGAILSFIGIPLMLGTLWALVPALLVLIDIIVRTALEDGVLRRELAGYTEYATRVKYRLIPGIW